MNGKATHYGEVLQNAGHYYGFDFDLTAPIKTLGAAQRDLLLYGVYGEPFRRHFPDTKPPTTVGKGNIEGVATNVMRRYHDHARSPDYRNDLMHLLVKQTCPDCGGDRLRPESRAVTVNGQTIIDLSRIPLSELATWLEALPATLPAEAQPIVTPILDDLHARVRRLVDVGADYLTMLRGSPTLSAGEAQRLRLASLLGSGLTGVLYVLDEPTLGLHQRDTARLVNVLRQLRDLGNTVLVIEHDLEMVRAADHVIDMGPGAGALGGEIVAAGTPDEIAAADSATGHYLSGRAAIPTPTRRRGNGKALTIHGAREHNLKNITVKLPLGKLIAVTGVSGSGKSSLMLDILDKAARQRFYNAGDAPGEHLAITGWEHVDKVITLDQSAIGRTTRSNAATYTDTFTAIRKVFRRASAGAGCETLLVQRQRRALRTLPGRGDAHGQHALPARRGGALPGVPGQTLQARNPGRDLSRGQHQRRAGDVHQRGGGAFRGRARRTQTPGPDGRRGDGLPQTRSARDDAERRRSAARQTGEGIGAQEPRGARSTCSTNPARACTSRTWRTCSRCCMVWWMAGNTVVVIEHNLDLIRASDWVIDLGPEGGDAGGEIVAQGTPEDVARVAGSPTGQALLEVIA